MLECIKFEDRKVKTIQIENKGFVAVRHIGVALGVSSNTQKGKVLINFNGISFQEKKLVLIALIMAANCSQQYLGPAESY